MDDNRSKNRWTGHELKEIGKALQTLPVNPMDRTYRRDDAIGFLVNDIKAAIDKGVPLETVVAALQKQGIKAGLERVRRLVAGSPAEPSRSTRSFAKGPEDV